MPVRVALRIVIFRESGVKLVSKEPNRLVIRFVFCHNVIVDDVITLVIRWKLGSHAAKAMSSRATTIVTNKYFGCLIIFNKVIIDT